MEDWMDELRRDRPEAAWDLFVDRYRRLIFSAIRRSTREHDEVMDVFARVCETLRADDLRRLRTYVAEPAHAARFTTWLVTVVHHIAIDWFRHRDGRPRLASIGEALTAPHRRIFEEVFVRNRTHVEAYEYLHARGLDLTFGEFLAELAATYRELEALGRGHLIRELGGPAPFAPADTSVELPIDADARDAMARALRTLSVDDRLALELYVIEGLPAVDVARILALPSAKSVYHRVYRALASLREHLERSGIRPGGS